MRRMSKPDLSLYRAALVSEIDARENCKRLVERAQKDNDFHMVSVYSDRVAFHSRAVKALDTILAARS
jgi:hypothetical protein